MYVWRNVGVMCDKLSQINRYRGRFSVIFFYHALLFMMGMMVKGKNHRLFHDVFSCYSGSVAILQIHSFNANMSRQELISCVLLGTKTHSSGPNDIKKTSIICIRRINTRAHMSSYFHFISCL